MRIFFTQNVCKVCAGYVYITAYVFVRGLYSCQTFLLFLANVVLCKMKPKILTAFVV